jgi:hypothetical protein
VNRADQQTIDRSQPADASGIDRVMSINGPALIISPVHGQEHPKE